MTKHSAKRKAALVAFLAAVGLACDPGMIGESGGGSAAERKAQGGGVDYERPGLSVTLLRDRGFADGFAYEFVDGARMRIPGSSASPSWEVNPASLTGQVIFAETAEPVDGRYRWLAPGRATWTDRQGGLTLAINTLAELDDFTTYPNPQPRGRMWPHSLVLQKLFDLEEKQTYRRSIYSAGDLDQLALSFDVDIRHVNTYGVTCDRSRYRACAGSSDPKDCPCYYDAAFVTSFLLLRYLGTDAAVRAMLGPHGVMWIGLKIFDTRLPQVCSETLHVDTVSGGIIFAVGDRRLRGSCRRAITEGLPRRFDVDMLPLIREGFTRAALPASAQLRDFYVEHLNFGWEVMRPAFNGDAVLSNVSLQMTPRAYMHPEIFDVEHYVAQNPDVARVLFGDALFVNRAAAIRHWVQHGIAEGRRSHPRFHAPSYVQRYSDLQAAFGGLEPRTRHLAAMWHYLRHGIAEGRSAAPANPSGE